MEDQLESALSKCTFGPTQIYPYTFEQMFQIDEQIHQSAQNFLRSCNSAFKQAQLDQLKREEKERKDLLDRHDPGKRHQIRKNSLPQHVVREMYGWFMDNIHNPYPEHADTIKWRKVLSPKQIKSWFVNERHRNEKYRQQQREQPTKK